MADGDKKSIHMEFDFTVTEWAKICAGLKITQNVMKEMEAEKGPMPDQIQKSYDVLGKMSDEINIKMLMSELEQDLNT